MAVDHEIATAATELVPTCHRAATEPRHLSATSVRLRAAQPGSPDRDVTQPARVHVDLYTRQQDLHIERLVGLGAERVEDWPYPPDADFIVLRDPDGNEFCVIDHDAISATV